MRDHQQFEQEQLANGITVYTYQAPFRTINLEAIFPVGAGHSHALNGFLPGSAHFLEHIQLIRSEQYPTPYALDRELGLHGGHSDGVTYPTATSHWVDIPANHQEFVSRAFVDRVFRPVFEESDFSTERTVIMNERNQRKFYPGKTPAGQHFYTKFLHDVLYPLEQLFGSDEDLHHMSRETMKAMHARVSQSPDTKIVAVGPSDFKELKRLLAALPTQPTTFNSQIESLSWANQTYSTHYFETISQPTLRVAWVLPTLSFEEHQAISFIISLLTNTTHGALYREFREERGWVYGLDGACSPRLHNALLTFTFPVNNKDQVEYIRECLVERITTATADQDMVEREIQRYRGSQVYNYQTAGEIISSASQSLIHHGVIRSEADYVAAISKMKDPAWRQTIVQKYFDPAQMGAVCFMPERRRMVPARSMEALASPN